MEVLKNSGGLRIFLTRGGKQVLINQIFQAEKREEEILKTLIIFSSFLSLADRLKLNSKAL